MRLGSLREYNGEWHEDLSVLHSKAHADQKKFLQPDIFGAKWRLLVWRYFVLTTNCALDPLLVDIHANLTQIPCILRTELEVFSWLYNKVKAD